MGLRRRPYILTNCTFLFCLRGVLLRLYLWGTAGIKEKRKKLQQAKTQ